MASGSDAPASIASFASELDALAVGAMADWQVPGVAIAVVQNDDVALLKGYGRRDVEADLPVTPDTQFLICSITKSFTATAIAMLQDEGRLDWSKPVREVLPEFRLHDAVATERVTILDLLSHQSGLPRHDWVHMAGDRSPAEMLALMRHLEPSRDIRAVWQYNNLCYNVLALLIERVSGQSYESFIRSRLTDRLGMTVSFTLDALEASAEPAVPYMMHRNERLRALRLPITTVGGGAINTSVKHLANWMRLHLGKGAFEGEQVVRPNLIAALHAPRAHNSSPGEFAEFGESHYGLGFQSGSYRGDRVVQHSGGWIGWGTLMTLLPELGVGIAVFTNRSPSQVAPILTWYLADRLRGREPVNFRERFQKQRDEMLAHEQADRDARAKARHSGTHPAHPLADYAGSYEHPAYGTMRIEHRAAELAWSWRGMWAELIHRHYETFELPEVPDRLLPDGLRITFLTDRDGNIVSLSAPLEPMVKDIVFARLPSGESTDPAFRNACVGVYKSGTTKHHVTQDAEGHLVLKPDQQPFYRLVPRQGRRFRIVELDGFFVEFAGEGGRIDEIIFHQPNGTFIGQRVTE